MNTLTQRPPLPGPPVRVVIAKPGLAAGTAEGMVPA
jgi:hypothetical protein